MIGLLDSGVGGLSVWRHVRALLPQEDLIYVADQAHVPYGSKPETAVRRFTEGITHFLRARGADLIVIACNTASAAALTWLRQTYPDIPFVGMEPAVKPAARQTRSGQVGVMATAGTFGSERYASLMRRFASNITVHEDPCAGLVELIEAGALETPAMRLRLRAILAPMLAQGVDTVVLGCTHYPFVRREIEAVAAELAPQARPLAVIDPAPAVARQAARVLAGLHGRAPAAGTTQLLTTGDPVEMARLVARLLDETHPVAAARWVNGRLVAG
ncbi:MAG: glutamate racemase [Anaerolineales bacterium]|nr:glutamate racemase [Anaerolineales bacterium]